MIADIFYPIFTLMITILACFIQKKKLAPTKASPWTPPPAAIIFGFAKNQHGHIFSVLSPDMFPFPLASD